MICFNQHMTSPRKSDVQPADTSKVSKIQITLVFFFISDIEQPEIVGLCIWMKKEV